MLTLKTLRDDPQAVIEKLKIKNFDAKPIVDRVLELDALRRKYQTESDELLSKQKAKSSEVGALMKQGLKDAAEKVKAEVSEMKAMSSELLAKMDEATAELESKLVLMPNTPYKLVKPGKGAEDNEVVKMGGPEVHLPENALPHWELAKKYEILISVSRLPVPVSLYIRAREPSFSGHLSISSSTTIPLPGTKRWSRL